MAFRQTRDAFKSAAGDDRPAAGSSSPTSRRRGPPSPPEIEWVPQLGFSRPCKPSWPWRWLAPFLEAGGWRALDLSGDEMAQPIETFQPLYRACKDRGMRLKAHVGEWGSADDVWRAVEVLELDEVRHGIAAAASPAVMRFLADHAITLNVCPTSNLLLGRVTRLEDHPIRALFDAGVRVTINSDDALVFGVGVSEEFLALRRAGVFTAPELDQMRRWSLDERSPAGPATG
jgi:adenosine deaminase